MFTQFKVIQETQVEELRAKALLLEHNKTKAQVLCLKNDDDNKTFSIGFKTPASNSTGVQHIIEHSVLCGSKSFSVKEPFAELLKGSLYTFLNALTAWDQTVYPVASKNSTDFLNLMRVYLDAVFFPTLSQDTFARQAWHLQSTGNALKLSGVVFNEMKGNYCSLPYLHTEAVCSGLFPDAYYRFDSAGDPLAIPDLSYADFLNFHKEHYHASNAKILLYGNGNLEQELALIHSYLERFEKREMNFGSATPTPFKEPKFLHCFYPLDPSSDRNSSDCYTVNWLLNEQSDQALTLKFGILAEILVGNDGAILKRALIESGLGAGLFGLNYFTFLKHNIFSFGLQGIKSKAGSEVESLIFDTLKRASLEGIPKALLDAAINSVDFTYKENLNAGDVGIRLMWPIFQVWQHAADPLHALEFAARLNALKQELHADPRLFEKLIEQHLINNQHRVSICFAPDELFLEKREKIELARLEKIRSNLKPGDFEKITENAKRLAQDATQADSETALNCIPKLSPLDVDKSLKITTQTVLDKERRILAHDLDTKGISYLDLAFSFGNVEQELLAYVPIYATCLFNTGTKRKSYADFCLEISSQSGGISTFTHVAPVRGTNRVDARLCISAQMQSSKVATVCALISEGLHEAKIQDKERLKQIILQIKTNFSRSITPNGMHLARSRAHALLAPAAYISEIISGLEYYSFLKDLLKKIEANNWDEILSNLEKVRRCILTQVNLSSSITSNIHTWDESHAQLLALQKALPLEFASQSDWLQSAESKVEAYIIPVEVNYIGQALDLRNNKYEYHGSMLVLQKFLTIGYLWQRIRVRGGAYGMGAVYNRDTGVFCFGSYRDPQLEQTLDTFNDCAEYLKDLELSATELERAIIGAIGTMDTAKSKHTLGFEAFVDYLCNRKPEDKQKEREQILSTTCDQFRNISDYLRAAKQDAKTVVIGGEGALQRLRERFKEEVRFFEL